MRLYNPYTGELVTWCRTLVDGKTVPSERATVDPGLIPTVVPTPTPRPSATPTATVTPTRTPAPGTPG